MNVRFSNILNQTGHKRLFGFLVKVQLFLAERSFSWKLALFLRVYDIYISNFKIIFHHLFGNKMSF